jgi:lysophospholipase L1-like esterase
MRSGDAALLASTFQRERRRAGSKARTELMTWLLAHPDATCPQLRAELPLDPPRTSWIGSSGRVFRNIRREEFRQVTRAAQQRLASLSAKHGFPVVVLTYLNYEATMQNDTLRELAGERDWPLVDLPRRYPREELGADDKRKYFSADRGHPNAEGYRLMATAILETMRRHGLVHAAR